MTIGKRTILKLAIRLLISLSLCTSTLFAQVAVRGPLEGVWKVTEIVITGAGAYTATAPQPSVFMFTKSHYSWMWLPGTQPRALFRAQVPTTDEKLAAFDSLAASSGRVAASPRVGACKKHVNQRPSTRSRR